MRTAKRSHILSLILPLLFSSCSTEFREESNTFIKYLGGTDTEQGIGCAKGKNDGYFVLANSTTFNDGVEKMTTFFLDEFGNLENFTNYGCNKAWALGREDGLIVSVGGRLSSDGNSDIYVYKISEGGTEIDSVVLDIGGADEFDATLNIGDLGQILITASSNLNGDISAIRWRLDQNLNIASFLQSGLPTQDKWAAASALTTDQTKTVTAGTVIDSVQWGKDAIVFVGQDELDQEWRLTMTGDQSTVDMVGDGTGDFKIFVNSEIQGIRHPLVVEWNEAMMDGTGTTLTSDTIPQLAGVQIKAIEGLGDGTVVLAGLRGSNDIVLVKLTASNKVEFLKDFGAVTDEDVRDVIQTDDGGFLMVGSRWINGHQSVMLIKTNDAGEL